MTKKIISILPAVLSVLFLFWLAVSYIDIVADNNSLQPVHHALNFFTVVFGGC